MVARPRRMRGWDREQSFFFQPKPKLCIPLISSSRLQCVFVIYGTLLMHKSPPIPILCIYIDVYAIFWTMRIRGWLIMILRIIEQLVIRVKWSIENKITFPPSAHNKFAVTGLSVTHQSLHLITTNNNMILNSFFGTREGQFIFSIKSIFYY